MKPFFIISIIYFFLLSCGSSKKECSETRDLPIVPSQGIGPYKLGMYEKELILVLCSEYTKREHKAWFSDKTSSSYYIENMSFICENGRLEEIWVYGTFKGKFKTIDVNYNKGSLEEYGDVIEHNDEYRILDAPNIAFGKEDGEEGTYIRIYLAE